MSLADWNFHRGFASALGFQNLCPMPRAQTQILPRNISPSSIIGLPDYPIEDITLRNIEIVYPGAGNAYYAQVELTPADLDSIPEMRKSYPEFSQFK